MRHFIEKLRTSCRFRDFGIMGEAITSRHIRCRPWWTPHLACSQAFIQKYLGNTTHNRIAVLGAGRLLDVDIESLLRSCREVHLFDADPGCPRVWRNHFSKQYGKTLIGHTTDLTQCLEEWSRAVRHARSREDLFERLSVLEAETPVWGAEAFDGCISLNILSQIPLYWRDRVLTMYPKWYDSVWEALTESMASLQTAHMQGLARNSRQWTALLTDTEYYFYHVDSSSWRIESALFGNAQELYNKQYKKPATESWWWHLAPQFIEDENEGEIHRVEATMFAVENK